MKLRRILSGALASAVAVSAMAVCASAEAVEPGYFLIGIADNDWKFQFWGKSSDSESIPYSLQSGTKLEGNGTYTISLDLSEGYTCDGWIDEDTGDLLELTTGNGVAAMGVQIYGEYPTLGVDIKSVKFDGTEVALNGTSFTNDEDNGRRTNVYNSWVTFDPEAEGIVAVDPATATTTLIDPAEVGEWTKIEVTFDVYGLDDAAPAETQAPAAGNVDAATDSSKGSPDTGAADVAAVAGLAIVAAGAVLVAKKRK